MSPKEGVGHSEQTVFLGNAAAEYMKLAGRVDVWSEYPTKQEMDEETWKSYTVQQQGEWMVGTRPSGRQYGVDALDAGLNMLIEVQETGEENDKMVLLPYCHCDEGIDVVSLVMLSKGQVESLKQSVSMVREQRGF